MLAPADPDRIGTLRPRSADLSGSPESARRGDVDKELPSPSHRWWWLAAPARGASASFNLAISSAPTFRLNCASYARFGSGPRSRLPSEPNRPSEPIRRNWTKLAPIICPSLPESSSTLDGLSRGTLTRRSRARRTLAGGDGGARRRPLFERRAREGGVERGGSRHAHLRVFPRRHFAPPEIAQLLEGDCGGRQGPLDARDPLFRRRFDPRRL
mmetsp:Transcript_24372/g.55496  ORF Transcript_24372/g.55496 Transcript_24372/m.55496 type:complete len:213 (-) Transcript_24372:887-1525(-)